MELIISKEQSTKQTTQAKKDVDVGASEQVAVKKQDQAGTARSKEKAKRRTRSKYVLLVKEQTEDNKKIEDKQKSQEVEEEEEAKNTKTAMDEVTKEIEEVEQSNNEEGQTYEEVEETKEEEKTRECGTIYSYAITEGNNMKSGDTNKHSTLFH